MIRIDWHGFEGWQMENDQARVVIVPALGGKIASLMDRTADYEWLAPPTNPPRPRQYGDIFVEHDLSGWDEMFPTINACPSPLDAATELPDHGEVWALPWQIVDESVHMLTLRIKGRSLPYTLTRRAQLEGDQLRLEYTLENNSDQPLPFLWAAHPLFNASPATRIGLPADITQVISVADHPRLGPPNRVLSWPLATRLDGSTQALDRADLPQARDYRKFYLPPEYSATQAWLWQADLQRGIQLSWDGQTAPYLGVWVDEGTYTRTSTVALEPSSGFYDSLALAQQNGRASSIPAQEKQQWWLSARLISVAPKG